MVLKLYVRAQNKKIAMKKFLLIVLVVGFTAWSCTSKSDSAASEDQGHSHSDGTEHTHADDNSDASHEQEEFVEMKEAFTVAITENSPEFIQHASGIQIIKDVANWESKVGVETLEVLHASGGMSGTTPSTS